MLRLFVLFFFQHIVFIVVGTGVLFMMIFHIGVNEPARSCTNSLASTKKGSKRCARNWTSWFKEVQFYQVSITKYEPPVSLFYVLIIDHEISIKI